MRSEDRLWITSTPIWAPHRFAHIGGGRHQARLDLAIERGGHQYVAALRARGINDEPAIRREARAFVIVGIGEPLRRRAAAEVERVEAERVALARDVSERAPIGADRRADV